MKMCLEWWCLVSCVVTLLKGGTSGAVQVDGQLVYADMAHVPSGQGVEAHSS